MRFWLLTGRKGAIFIDEGGRLHTSAVVLGVWDDSSGRIFFWGGACRDWGPLDRDGRCESTKF